jgi:hypothetical protein
MSGGVVERRDHPDHRIAHLRQAVVIDHIAWTDQSDIGFGKVAVGVLLCKGGRLQRRHHGRRTLSQRAQ